MPTAWQARPFNPRCDKSPISLFVRFVTSE